MNKTVVIASCVGVFSFALAVAFAVTFLLRPVYHVEVIGKVTGKVTVLETKYYDLDECKFIAAAINLAFLEGFPEELSAECKE